MTSRENNYTIAENKENSQVTFSVSTSTGHVTINTVKGERNDILAYCICFIYFNRYTLFLPRNVCSLWPLVLTPTVNKWRCKREKKKKKEKKGLREIVVNV